MKMLFRLKQIVLILLCFVLLSACVPTHASNITTNTLSTDTTTATALGTTSTTVATTAVTAKATTTTTMAKETTTTLLATTTVSRTAATRGDRTDIKLKFDYDSENYDVLRGVILREFPEEKNLDEFRVTKGKYEEGQYLYQIGAAFSVTLRRWINGCSTENSYTFIFDANGDLFRFEYFNPVYDASAVKPPRVPTEAEIEQAKKTEAAKIPENCIVWKQKVSVGYSISTDTCSFSVQTLYTHKANVETYLNENSPLYGKTPPHAAIVGEYIIPR